MSEVISTTAGQFLMAAMLVVAILLMAKAATIVLQMTIDYLDRRNND